MEKYNVNVAEVKRALASGYFGISLTWQKVCSRPDLARRVLEEYAKVKSFQPGGSGMFADQPGTVMHRLTAGKPGKKTNCVGSPSR